MSTATSSPKKDVADAPAVPPPPPLPDVEVLPRPPSPPTGPFKPEAFAAFERDLVRIYRSYSASTLDKKAQPLLLRDIMAFAEVCRDRMKDAKSKDPALAPLAAYARDFFSSEAEDEYNWSSKIRTLLLAAVEWLPRVAVPSPAPIASPVEAALLFLDLVVALPAVELDLKCEACERALEALAEYDEFFPVVHRFAFRCVMMANPSCLPQLDVPATDSWQPDVPLGLSPVEKALVAGNPEAMELLAGDAFPLCAAHCYFPYVVAVLPSKTLAFVTARFPKLTVRFSHWACSGHVQSQVVTALRKCGCKQLTRLAPADLADCSCDIVLGLLAQFRELIVSHGKSFEKCVEVLLERRSTILAVDETPAGPVATRKLRRLDDTVVDMLRATSLNLLVVFPQLRSMMDRHGFPLGTVELNAVGATIVEQCRNDRIDLLLPLFQLPNDVITESHWIALFTAAHQSELMEKAMFLCLTVVQVPRRVRYLIRRAFPQLDEPQQPDQQLREVAKKLCVLIGPY